MLSSPVLVYLNPTPSWPTRLQHEEAFPCPPTLTPSCRLL